MTCWAHAAAVVPSCTAAHRYLLLLLVCALLLFLLLLYSRSTSSATMVSNLDLQQDLAPLTVYTYRRQRPAYKQRHPDGVGTTGRSTTSPAPQEPVPAPHEPVPAPQEPVPAPQEPVPASQVHEPVPAPQVPVPLLATSATFQGGLGNHMFIFASVYGLVSRTRRRQMFVQDDPSSCKLCRYFLLPNVSFYSDYTLWRSQYEPVKDFSESELDSVSYSDKVLQWTKSNQLHNTMYHGYYQSYKYFSSVRDQILRQFTFTSESGIVDVVDREFRAIRERYVSKPGTENVYVGLHIRRGDYLQPHFQKFGYKVGSAEYFQRGMEYFVDQLSGNNTDELSPSGNNTDELSPSGNNTRQWRRVIFVVASQDLAWCRENLDSERYNIWFSEDHGPGEDMAILARCDHSLLSVGSFGWWSAYLKPAHSVTVYMRDLVTPGSRLHSIFRVKDYYPEHWIPL